jgi:enoyl-CoA hydratase
MPEPTEPEILFDRRGAAGIVTLNRPRALNALTLAMIRQLRAKLDIWRDDDSVTRVIMTAAGGRAFSAGGDLREIYDLGHAGRQAQALHFFREEYQLNAIIKRYPKPYIALIDGIVMGGGVGISVHGSHRVPASGVSSQCRRLASDSFPMSEGRGFYRDWRVKSEPIAR